MDTHLLYPALETKEICRVAAVLLKNRSDLTNRHAQKTFYGQSIGWKRVSTQTLPFIVSAFNPAAPDKSNIFFSPVSEPSHAPSDLFQFFRPRASAILLRTQTLRVQIRPSETSNIVPDMHFPNNQTLFSRPNHLINPAAPPLQAHEVAFDNSVRSTRCAKPSRSVSAAVS